MMDSGVDSFTGAAARKHLTLLFVDLSGSSHLAEALEAEQFAEILKTLRVASRASIERFGGHVVRIQGDGVLAMFGYPVTAEDDGLRAAQAALELHDSFDRAHRAELPTRLRPLQLHSGLHSGLVLVSEGDVERGRFELIGDAANTAARLSQLAPRGTVLADVDSLGPHARHFELDGLSDLSLPGRSSRVRVARLVRYEGRARTVAQGASRREVSPFCGREDLLRQLGAELALSASARQRRKIILQGPAGIGKSRLLGEVARLPQAAAWVCLRGACADASRSQVLEPFVEMMRARQEPTSDGTVGLADELFAAVQRAANGRPLLLLIDDWHWADDASRQLLERLLSSVPVLVAVLASRPSQDMPDTPGDGDLRIDLAPFDETETTRLVKMRLPAADPFTIGEIQRHAGGVPLYVEELAHSVESQQPLRPMQRISTSSWLVALVVLRLERLTREQQEVVRTAAVLGDSFPVWLLLAVGGWREGDLDQGALAQADFLFPVPGKHRLRFKHGLARTAVYDTVGLHERRAMHRRATRALTEAASGTPSMEVLEGLAYHSRAAGLWDEAADHAEHAADQAGAAFSMDVARRHYLAVLEALEARGLPDAGMGDTTRLVRWCKVVHKLGMTCIFDPLALPDTVALFERCLVRAQATRDTGLVARSLYWLGYMSYGQGLPRRAARYCREALAMARTLNDPRLTAQLEATLGQVLAAASAYDEALPLMDRALATKQQGPRRSASVAVGSAFTLACKGSVLADRGDFASAHALLAEATQLVGDSPHPVANSVRNWAMVVLLWQGRWRDAIEVTGHSVRMAHSTHALLPLAISRASEGYARWMGLNTSGSLQQIAEAVDWMEQRHGRFFTSIFHGWLVEGFVAMGDVASVRHHAAALLSRARAGELLGLAAGWRALALAAVQAGDPHRAERRLAHAQACATQRASRRETALNTLCRAQMLQHLQRPTEASLHAAIAKAEFDAMDMRWHAERAGALQMR